MTFDLSTIKKHAEDYIHAKITGMDQSYHNVVREFYSFLEGKSAEAEAVELLKGLGYTITEPANPQ